LAAAGQADVERIVKSCGFFRMKAKNIIAASRRWSSGTAVRFPTTAMRSKRCPGVGRKTANVVLSVAFAEAAFAVDTHVFRVAHRLGLTLGKTPRQVEDDVVKLVPPDKLRHAHHWLILHGRAVCKAPVPHCGQCPVATLCPSAKLVAAAISASAKTRAVPARPGAPGGATPRRGRAS
jgi:endonuclease-3